MKEASVDIEILNEERLRYWCGRIDLPEAAVDDLARIARQTMGNEVLSAVFAAEYEKRVLRGEWLPLAFDPAVEELLGERASLFYLLAYLAALPAAEREYLRRGISLDIFDATMSDIRTWLVHEYDLFGRWMFRQFYWTHHHLSCKLFRLGRMQYMLSHFEGSVRAFRRKADGEMRLLAGDQMLLRPDGWAFGAGRVRPDEPFYCGPTAEPEESWTAVFTEQDEGWRGSPISPYGNALKESVFLSRSEWELALQPGDTVLDMHIPRKDPFSPEACRDSLRQAQTFFSRFYPERSYKAAACHTWFFGPQLQRILPPDSNIVRFQREFYLYPVAGSPGFLWNYVFGEKVSAMSTAPRDTALRRAVLDWLEGGGELFDLAGVMFHGADEWGSQPYMRNWD